MVPDAAARTRAIRLPHDYMTQRLAGRGVTDRGDASGTGWWTPSTGAYADEILGLTEVAIDRAMLPALLGRDRDGERDQSDPPPNRLAVLGDAGGGVVDDSFDDGGVEDRHLRAGRAE